VPVKELINKLYRCTKKNRTISEGSMPWGAATVDPASETKRGRRTSLENIVEG
jgi:hypothetical protein